MTPAVKSNPFYWELTYWIYTNNYYHQLYQFGSGLAGSYIKGLVCTRGLPNATDYNYQFIARCFLDADLKKNVQLNLTSPKLSMHY